MTALGTWLAALGPRERVLLGVAGGVLGGVLAFRAIVAVHDDLTTLHAVSLDDIAGVLAAYPLDRVTTVAVGPMTEAEFREAVL